MTVKRKKRSIVQLFQKRNRYFLLRFILYKTNSIRFLRNKKEIIFTKFCLHLKLENKVVFDNFFGRFPADDPKFIALQLRKMRPDIQLIWLVNNRWIQLPDGFEKCYYNSIEADFHLRTAKVWVDNVKNAYRPPKRKGQYYIQTWHGIMGLKSVEAEVPNLSQEYAEAAKADAAKTDLMYANNDHQLNLYKHSFWYQGRVIKCDVPKISILVSTPRHLKEKVYSFFQLSLDTKIALYAPTFRDSADANSICWDYDQAIHALEQRFGGTFILLVRLHPNHYFLDEKINYSGNIISATNYDDIQELLAVSDVLINDYSSTMFEFGLTRKPVFLICQDYKEYVQERPLKFSLKELPYPSALSVSDLISNILSFNCEKYQKNLDIFHHQTGLTDKGKGAEIIANIISEHCVKEG